VLPVVDPVANIQREHKLELEQLGQLTSVPAPDGLLSFRVPDLVLIPGLGADERQFEPQRAAFPFLRVPRWLDWRPRETLAEYAARLGSSAGLTRDSIVGGSSFGGMLALEIAREFRCRAAVLIGSCRAPEAVSPMLRMIERCARPIPAQLIGAATPLGAPLLRLFDPVRGEDARLLVRMGRDADPVFLKRGGRALFNWPGCADPAVPVFHIHGTRDPFIPAARVKPDILLEGHGHFLNLTAPAEINRFLTSVLDC
jgi:pimeloyl-ACP methyl ester carboxylesterase